jgi:2-hydroxychromene-2-carboxylate isomerase
MVMTNEIDFYTSPTCPWAWRTALWIRQVAAQTPLQINWKVLSLHIVNRGHDYAPDSHAFGYKGEILLIAARQFGGNAAFERLYMALGDVLQLRKEERTDTMLTGALAAAGLPEQLYADSRSDASFERALIAEHEHAVSELDAFGVPTIRIPGSKLAFFGPVVDPVPTGAEALELWRHVQWSLDKPYLFEVKRTRRHRAGALGLADVQETLEPVSATSR